MSDKNFEAIRPGSVVRVFSRIGTGIWRALFGHVVTVTRKEGQDQPTLSVVTVDPAHDQIALGRSDWKLAVERHVGVEHASHADVQDNRTSVYWLDGMGPAHEMPLGVGHPASDTKENLPAEAPASPEPNDTPLTPVPAASIEADAPKIATIDGVPGELNVTDEVEVSGQMVEIGKLTTGMELTELKLEVTGVEVENGRLHVITKPTEQLQQQSELKGEGGPSPESLNAATPGTATPEDSVGTGASNAA